MDTSSSRRPAYATAKARNVAAIPDVLREFGVDIPAILQKAGLDPNFFGDLEQVMPYASLGRLLTESVKATGCESFGLRVGAKTKLNSLGLTSLVSLNSPTVRDALQVIVATLKTSETGGATSLDVRGGLASFGYTVVAPNIESVDQIEDGSLAIAFNILRRLCGPAWRPILVRLTRDPPRDKTPFQRVLRGAGRIRRAVRLSRLRRRDARRAGARPQPRLRGHPRAPAGRGDRQCAGRLRRVGQVDHPHPDRRGRAQPRQRLPRARPQRAQLRPTGSRRMA